jgi:hypothetical protein
VSFDGTFEAVDLVFWCPLALVGEALAFVAMRSRWSAMRLRLSPSGAAASRARRSAR